MEDGEEKACGILEAEAGKAVLEQYPKLRETPQNNHILEFAGKKTSNRLYNCILPLIDNSIAFVGNIYMPNGFRVAEVQAIWATRCLAEI